MMNNELSFKHLEDVVEFDEFWKDFEVKNKTSSSSSTNQHNDHTIEKEDKTFSRGLAQRDEVDIYDSIYDTNSEQEWQLSFIEN